MSSRAVEDSRKTGRGSCGSGAPRGVSTQIRQALMRPASAAGLEIECLSVMPIARPAGSIPGCRAWSVAHVSGGGLLRQKAGDSRLIPCFSQAPPDRLGRFRVNFELLALPVRPLTHTKVYRFGFMPAASVKSLAVLTVRPRPVLVANQLNDRFSGSFISFRHRRHDLSREARIERVF